MKKKALISSILTIALCLSLIAGSTFALFTATSGVNVAISSATVDVQATILEDTLKTFSLGVEQAKGEFENGGTALFADATNAKELVLTNITPGDMATFTINVENNSNVTVKYRFKWFVDGALYEALTATVTPEDEEAAELLNNTTPWATWEPTEDEDEMNKTFDVSVLLPTSIGNDFQDKTASIQFVVEAVQGNGTELIVLNNTKYATADEAFAAAADGETIEFYGAQVPFTVPAKNVNLVFNDVEIYAATEGQSALTLASGFAGTITMNGKNYLTGAKNGSAIEVEAGATLNLSGDTLVAVGNNGKDYAANAPQYSSDDSATEYAGTGASAIGGEGTINIDGVKSLTAKGYGIAGFGIGGYSASISIANTTIEYARGGYVNENDTHVDEKYLKTEPEGGAAIGTLVTGTEITLNNVVVKEAIGGSKAAGIGARYWTGVTVNITDSTIEKVVGGNSSAGIGGSRVQQNDSTAVVVINITDSNVNAIGGRYGAGIGSGYDTHCSSTQPELTINISGTAANTVTAQGGTYAAGIGTGYHNAMLAGAITGDVVINATAGDTYYKDAYTRAQDIGFGVVDPTREAKDNDSSINYKGTIIAIPTVITADTDLVAALTSDAETINVVLSNDVDVAISDFGKQVGGSGQYRLGGENTKEIVIDLGGKTLNIETTYWSALGTKNPDATLVIKNGTMTSSQTSGTWNSYDLCFNDCNLVVENVTFEKAIALEAAGKTATLTDVTINETHDYYGLWICALGQTVTLDNVTINSAGRAIKIADEYNEDEAARVTLNITDSKFVSAKKAAILVASPAGAVITVDNLDISEVAADSVNYAWKDNGKSAWTSASVTVNGVECIVEP